MFFAAGAVADRNGIARLRDLREACGYMDRRSLRSALSELVGVGLAVMAGATARRVAVFPHLGAKDDTCDDCGDPRSRFGAIARCPSCHQRWGRPDRAWLSQALAIFARGVARGDDEWTIAVRIHVKTGRSLWGRSCAGVQGSGSGDDEGVIPTMVGLGLFEEHMLKRAKRARGGDDGV